MPSYLLKMTPLEVVHILRAETESAYGAPELNTSAWKEYEIEEEFDHALYGATTDGESIVLATSVATLTVEPRVERDYWILEAIISRTLGPFPIEHENGFSRVELTPTEFEAEMRSAGNKRMAVRLNVETPVAKQHFDSWLAEMRRKHP